MYATDAASDALYIIDTETTERKPLGPSGMGIGVTTPVDLATDPLSGRIFVANNSPPELAGLLEVDRHTGIATHIGGSVRSIAFGSDGTLYTQMGPGPVPAPSELGVVDIGTGIATSLGGDILPDLFGMSFNRADGFIYGMSSEGIDSEPSLLKISTKGELISQIKMSTPIYGPGGIAFDSKGNLIGSSIRDQLFNIDIVSGDMFSFRTGEGPQGFDRIVDVPEPCSVALICLGLLLCVNRRGRGKWAKSAIDAGGARVGGSLARLLYLVLIYECAHAGPSI